MRVTVGVCTWNRAALLARALEAMERLRVPPGVEWELVIADNGSTDGTAEVVARFARALPLRRVFEPVPGKSHALNRVVREAAGDYIVWTDDDALVDEDWLAAYCRAFARWPDAAVLGGPIEPRFEGRPPRWLGAVAARLAGVYAARSFGPDPVPLGGAVMPYGANLAVRAAEQRRFPYRPEFGPRPDNVFGGEETDMVARMLAAGLRGWWVPDARVEHLIPRVRQTTAYVRRYFRGYGERLARLERPAGGRTLLGRPLWLWRQALEAEARYRVRRVTRGPAVWIEDLIAASMAWGGLRAYRRVGGSGRDVPAGHGPGGPGRGVSGDDGAAAARKRAYRSSPSS